MKDKQVFPLFRLLAYAVSAGIFAFQWLSKNSVDSWPNLCAYLLFFVVTLSLAKTKRRHLLWVGIIIVIVMATRIIDYRAVVLSADFETAMMSMKMMMAVTVIQNVIFSAYLVGAFSLLRRESHQMLQVFGWGVAVFFALRLFPASWFTLQFIFSAAAQ